MTMTKASLCPFSLCDVAPIKTLIYHHLRPMFFSRRSGRIRRIILTIPQWIAGSHARRSCAVCNLLHVLSISAKDPFHFSDLFFSLYHWATCVWHHYHHPHVVCVCYCVNDACDRIPAMSCCCWKDILNCEKILRYKRRRWRRIA